MIERTDARRLQHIGRGVIFVLIMILVCTIGIQWSWNVVASELFTLPPMQFTHALGLEILMGLLFFIFGVTGRVFLGRPQCRMK